MSSFTLDSQFIVNSSSIDPIIVNNTSSTTGNDILFQNNSTNIVGFGNNQTTNEAYSWVYANQPLKFGTNNIERFRIDAAGISNNNSAVNVLALSPSDSTSLVYKNNIADTSSVQTFSNKTLDSTCKIQGSSIVGEYTSNIVSNFPILFNTAGLTAPRLITWPDSAGTISFSNSTETLSNKTLDSTCKINGSTIVGFYTSNLTTDFPVAFDTTELTAPQLWTFPNTTDTFAGLTTGGTFSGKTIDSSTNTLTITNAPLSGANINSLINQAIETTSSPSFSGISLTGISNDNTQTKLLALNGSNSIVYRNSTTIPKIANVMASLAANQSLSNATFTIIKFDTVSNSSSHLTYSTSTGIFTCVDAGIYTFCCSIQLSGVAGGQRIGIFSYNSNTIQTIDNAPIGTDGPCLLISTTLQLVATDTITVQIFQDSGSTQNILGTTQNVTLATRINITGIINS
jgi:hypothetical protein